MTSDPSERDSIRGDDRKNSCLSPLGYLALPSGPATWGTSVQTFTKQF